MRRLSDTIARLSALSGQLLPDHGVDTPTPLHELAGFGSNPGNLKALLHLPADLPSRSALVVVLHGCTQNAASYDRGSGWSALADRHGFAVLFPEQQRANNPNGCFNWFVPVDTRRMGGEAQSIAQMIAATVSTHDIDPARVFITGLSAGGAMTSVMLATYPELFAGGAIIAGLAHGVAGNVPQALERMRGHGLPDAETLGRLVRAASDHRGPWPTVAVWHGTADATVAFGNAAAIVDQWRALHGVGAPDPVELVNGHARTVWRDRSGRVAIDLYAVAGLGHGTPLATHGPERCGIAGPHMLEAGISSTVRIARSWQLVGPAAPDADNGAEQADRVQRGSPSRPVEPAGPARVIADALRGAGLLR